MKPKQFVSLLFIINIFFVSCSSQEPTVWRGADNGVYPGENYLESWPASGPEILWVYEDLGQGHSSPVAAGGNVYTTGMKDSIGYLFKFGRNGDVVYTKEYGPEYKESFYGPRGTPVIYGTEIYIVSGYGVLYCLKEKDGSLIWKKDLVKDYKGEVIRWGYNETPVINGNLIYVTPGGKEHCLIALNLETGDLVWSSKGSGELSAYCTPLLFEHNGRKILATHTASHLFAVDAISGEFLWKYPQPNQWSVHANTPIYHDGGLFFFSGYGQGSGKLNLNEDGTSVELAWENESMDSRMGGAVLIDGYIYGSGDFKRTWKCIDWETGENKWESNEIAKGVVISADNKLYCYSDKGELAMAKVDSSSFVLSGKTRVTKGSEQHWAHPMINDGVLYVRHGKALIAYKIK